jgi:hypothetical protein
MIRPVREGGHGLVSNRQVFDVQTLTTALLLDPHVSGRTYKVRPSPCLDAHELGRQLGAVWEHLSACRLCLKGELVILGIALNRTISRQAARQYSVTCCGGLGTFSGVLQNGEFGQDKYVPSLDSFSTSGV